MSYIWNIKNSVWQKSSTFLNVHIHWDPLSLYVDKISLQAFRFDNCKLKKLLKNAADTAREQGNCVLSLTSWEFHTSHKQLLILFFPSLCIISFLWCTDSNISWSHAFVRLCACVRVCARGLMSVMLVLEGYKTAGVFLTFLRRLYLFSLASVGSAICSGATFLPGTRTPLPSTNNNNKKLDNSLKKCKNLLYSENEWTCHTFTHWENL